MEIDFSSDVLFERWSQPLARIDDPLRPLLEAETLIPGGGGTLAMRGICATLLDGINRDLRRFAASLGAEEAVLPASVSLADLSATGYLDRFPQFTTLLSGRPPAEGTPDQPTRACCSAVCHSAYPCFRGKVFGPGSDLALTALGRAFRRETLDPRNLERLSEFQMREIIFFGTEKFVDDSLRSCVAWMKELLLEGELRGAIETAEDPFFGPEAATLSEYQRVNRSKFELRLAKPLSGERVAVASINRHGTHFSKAFDIRAAGGGYIHTGCFGVGLERLLLLSLQQHGPEVTRWPTRLRERFAHSK